MQNLTGLSWGVQCFWQFRSRIPCQECLRRPHSSSEHLGRRHRRCQLHSTMLSTITTLVTVTSLVTEHSIGISGSQLPTSENETAPSVQRVGAFHWVIQRPTINRRTMERIWATHGSPAGGRKASGLKARVHSGCVWYDNVYQRLP